MKSPTPAPTSRAEAQQHYRKATRYVLTDAARTDLDAGVWQKTPTSQHWCLIGAEHALRFAKDAGSPHVFAQDIAQFTPRAKLEHF